MSKRQTAVGRGREAGGRRLGPLMPRPMPRVRRCQPDPAQGRPVPVVPWVPSSSASLTEEAINRPQLGLGEGEVVEGGHVVVNLADPTRADEGGGDSGLPQHPRKEGK